MPPWYVIRAGNQERNRRIMAHDVAEEIVYDETLYKELLAEMVLKYV